MLVISSIVVARLKMFSQNRILEIQDDGTEKISVESVEQYCKVLIL